MGRFTAYDQNGRTVADFDKGEYDLMHGWVGTEMERLRIENGKLRELVGDIWEFGFSNSAGANSVKEWYRVRDELEQRVYAALGAEVDG